MDKENRDRGYRIYVAQSDVQVDAALRLRADVFAGEENYLTQEGCPGGREGDSRDFDERTIHVLVEHPDDGVVGVGRLEIRPPLAGTGFSSFGFALERSYDLRVLALLAVQPVAEVSRVAVRRRHRGAGGATRHLIYELGRQAVAAGARYWVGDANCETPSAWAARDIYTRLRELGLISHIPFALREPPVELAPRRPSDASLCELPHILTSYERTARVRFAGYPHLDPKFGRYAIGFIADPRFAVTRCRPWP